jgi:alpha-glucosidase
VTAREHQNARTRRPGSHVFRAVLTVFLLACTTPAPASDAGLDAAAMDAGMRDPDVFVPRCRGGGAPPAWAREEDAPHRWRFECGERAISIWSLRDGVVRVRYLDVDDVGVDRSFALDASALEGDAIEVAELEDGSAGVCTPSWTLTVTPACLVEARGLDGRVFIEDLEASATEVVRATPDAEPFYGLGEKTGALDRRGRRFTFWNTDAYDPAFGGYRPDQDPLYLSIPFFIALRDGAAYGVFTDSAWRVDMDLAATDRDRYRIATEGPRLDQYLVAGPRMAEVVRRYTGLTGRTPLPPRWALGFHQSRWGYAPASRLEELARQFRLRGIPADALWLDIQHMDGFRTFTFDPVAFPDPEALFASLREDGFRTIAIADPGLKVDAAWSVYTRAIDDDLVLMEGDDPFVGEAWPGPSVFLDYTLPAARAFWAEHIAASAERGLSGIWLDVNEPTVFPESGGAGEVPNEIAIDGDGIATTMAEGHNVYALHQARATFEGLAASAPDRRPFILSRAGYAGIQRYAAVWTGDAPSTWDSLAQTPAMLMSLGLSGVPFAGSDIGGYSGNATPELFARWMQVGAFSPFCRAHVTNGVPDQEPWAFGTEVEDISRHRLRERYALLPYLYSLFAEAAWSGAPVLRPMVYEFQDDPELHRTGDQMMLGPWILIAPVLEMGAITRRVRLPAGRWTEIDSGAIYQGPGEIEVSVTRAGVPTFVREGAILVRTSAVDHTGIAPSGPLRVDLYPSAEPTAFVLYEDAGDGFGEASRTRFELASTGIGAELTIHPREGGYAIGAREIELRVHGVDRGVRGVLADGEALTERASLEALSELGGYFFDARDRTIAVRMDDRAPVTIVFDYDASIETLRPAVEVEIEVTVPEGTPLDPRVHIATSLDGWTAHRPLEWIGPNLARVTIAVPRGEWFFYKFTRGTWETVEKWPDCAEADNRYGFGSAYPLRRDTVFGWRDWCE